LIEYFGKTIIIEVIMVLLFLIYWRDIMDEIALVRATSSVGQLKSIFEKHEKLHKERQHITY
jgi:hypothetical protein